MTVRRFFSHIGVAALLAASVLHVASAQVLFDNFGPGNTFRLAQG